MIFGGSSRGSLADVAYFRPKLEMTVSDINAYGLVIGGSLIIILSYFANLLANKID
jgi:hypothetical protein